MHTNEQTELAAKFVANEQSQYLGPILTEVISKVVFWPAENYH